MKLALPMLFLLSLSGCEQAAYDADMELDALKIASVSKDMERYLGEEAKLVAVCGPSKGMGFYLDSPEEGFQPDGISQGVIGLAFRKGGQPEILFRDSLDAMIVATEDGGKVTHQSSPNDPDLGIWIAEHRGGVVETYNLTYDSDGRLAVLWTGNKQGDVLNGRVFAFVSKCQKPT